MTYFIQNFNSTQYLAEVATNQAEEFTRVYQEAQELLETIEAPEDESSEEYSDLTASFEVFNQAFKDLRADLVALKRTLGLLSHVPSFTSYRLGIGRAA